MGRIVTRRPLAATRVPPEAIGGLGTRVFVPETPLRRRVLPLRTPLVTVIGVIGEAPSQVAHGRLHLGASQTASIGVDDAFTSEPVRVAQTVVMGTGDQELIERLHGSQGRLSHGGPSGCALPPTEVCPMLIHR